MSVCTLFHTHSNNKYISINYCLGVVDKLMTEFENRVFLTKKAGRRFIDEFLKKV